MGFDCEGDDGAGLRTNMERKRILNARQTAMRQRKFQRLAKQKEEEEKRIVKEALECRKKERARLSAYLHPPNSKNSSQQLLRTHQENSLKGKPTKPCIVQNHDFAARLRESIKAAAHDSFLGDETRQLFFRMATHVPTRVPLDDLSWDQRLLGSFDEETDKDSLKKCAATKNLRVTFGPAAVLKEDSPRQNHEKNFFGEQLNGQFAGDGDDDEDREYDRPLSPTIVLDGPDPDSSSNSSFLAQNAEPLSKLAISRVAGDEKKTSIDDMNAFLEEALKLRLDNEAATTRMIAEVTGLESRLDELQPMNRVPSPKSCEARMENDVALNRKDDLDVAVSQDTVQFSQASGYSRFEEHDVNRRPGRDCKVYRSDAWEVCSNDLENGGQLCQFQSKQQDPTTSVEIPSGEDASKHCISGGGSFPSRNGTYALQHHSSMDSRDARSFKNRARNADLAALLREESNVLASIERIDWKLASAVARCRDSGLSDGHYSVQSAPTVISQGNRSTRSNGGRRYDSARAETSHSSNRPRRRQNVGLTNKLHDGRFLYPRSQSRGESYPQIVDRTLEPRCAPSNVREGVIVFHPDAYCMLNPVASP